MRSHNVDAGSADVLVRIERAARRNPSQSVPRRASRHANFFTLTDVHASRSMRTRTSAVPAREPVNPIKAQIQKELKDAGWHSRGYLPHFDGGEIAQTINLHLADSVPRHVIERWQIELSKTAADMKSIIRRRIERYL